jgi:ADP-heptose:LPS heptosyltransferase
VSAPLTWPSVGYGTLPLRRVLVVQTQRMGDVLCATPVLAALRRGLPAVHITALVHHPFHVVLQNSADVDAVLTYDRKGDDRSLSRRFRLIGTLREGGYDWALVIHAASSVAFALWQSGIPWRTCIWRYGDRTRPHWHRFYHQHVRQDREPGEKHEIEYNKDALRELGFHPEPDLSYRVCLTAEEQREADGLLAAQGREAGRPLAVLHPGHGGGRQEWSPEAYAAVGNGLARRGFQVAITGSPSERHRAEQLARSMREPAVQLAGEASLRLLMGILARTSLFVSVSTGPMHLAGAMRVPTVTLFGPTDMRPHAVRWCAHGAPQRGVLSPVVCPCAGSRNCARPVCMEAITPEMVLEASEALVAAPSLVRSVQPAGG